MNILVGEAGLCRGIELAYAKMNKLAGEIGLMKATHRAGSRAASRWDPLQRIGSDAAELLKRYPGLANVTVVEGLDAVEQGDVVVVGHKGIDRQFIEGATSKGAVLHDSQCPFMRKYDATASSLAKEGHDLIIFGKPGNHHCLYAKGLAESAGRVGLIAEKVCDIADELDVKGRKWACIVQVTGNSAGWERFKTDLSQTGVEAKVCDTLCPDSLSRQESAREMARRADAVIIVNDCGGSTQSVLEQCRAVNSRTFSYDPDDAFPAQWLEGAETVALTGGIHVPAWLLDGIAGEMRSHASR